MLREPSRCAGPDLQVGMGTMGAAAGPYWGTLGHGIGARPEPPRCSWAADEVSLPAAGPM